MSENGHQRIAFLAYPLKVMVSPFRAFRVIGQNPDLKGIALIVGLILMATTGLYVAYSAKVLIYINGIPTNFLTSNMFPSFIASVLIQETLAFAENWLLYAGILFLVMRAFGQKGGSWRPFFTLVGYAFSIMIIHLAVNALFAATLPEIHFHNLQTWPPSTQDEATIANTKIQETWGPTPSYQALLYINFPYVNITDVWLAILSAIIVKTFSDITWGKAIAISITALILRLFLKIFLGF